MATYQEQAVVGPGVESEQLWESAKIRMHRSLREESIHQVCLARISHRGSEWSTRPG